MNKLTIFERELPLRAYPNDTLDKALDTQFKFWLANLLSLKEDKEDAYDVCKPALKELCIGMSFAEIKKMFEYYADSKLSLKPIPNYFDRILLGKIISEYKAITKKPIKQIENTMNEEDKELIMIEAVDRIKKEVKHNGEITSGCSHVYDYLDEKGLLPKDKESKLKVWELAKEIVLEEAKYKASIDYEIHRHLKETLKQIDKGNSKVVSVSKN